MAEMRTYDVDWDKVTTVEDLRGILQACSLEFFEDPVKPNEVLDSVRHLLVPRPV